MQTTLFKTEPDARAARQATQQLAAADTTGYDGYYGEAEHLAILAQCGFNSTKEYEAAYEQLPEVIAYDKFNRVFKIVTHGSAEYKAIIQGLKSNGLWNEEDNSHRGLEYWEITSAAAPKHAQLVELVYELGLKWPVMHWN